jgi:hypothetical protein
VTDRPEPVAKSEVAIVRRALQSLSDIERGSSGALRVVIRLRRLLSKLPFDSDPNSPSFNASALERIERVARETLADKTTLICHSFKDLSSNDHACHHYLTNSKERCMGRLIGFRTRGVASSFQARRAKGSVGD